jgi:hypothetical protein
VTPEQLLYLTIAVTATAAAAQCLAVHRRRNSLRKLGKLWQMHYAPGDRMKLADRIAPKIPVIGAANVCVMDMLFRTDEDRHRYLFTVEYGIGAVRGKRRRWRVVGFDEPVSRGGEETQDCPLVLAPLDLRLPAAYEYVFDALTAATKHGKSGKTTLP